MKLYSYRITLVMFLAGVGSFHLSSQAMADPTPPRQFPDISGFTSIPVQTSNVSASVLSKSKLAFSTPEGMKCTMKGNGGVICDGHYAAYYPHDTGLASPGTCLDYNIRVSEVTSKEAANDTITEWDVSCAIPHPDANLMHPRQKITFNNATCAIADNHVLGCWNERHGFILRPGGNNIYY